MDEQLDRVKGKIRDHILAFFEHRIARGKREFHCYELYYYIKKDKMVRCSPSSADRVMREMATKTKELGYTLLDRGDSLYYADWVGTEQLSLFERSA